jgi:hypothetical protein
MATNTYIRLTSHWPAAYPSSGFDAEGARNA